MCNEDKKACTEGGGQFEFPTATHPPPPPRPPLPDPPKVFEPVFLQFEILEARVRAEKKIFALLEGLSFFLHPMRLYSKYSEFCGEIKNV